MAKPTAEQLANWDRQHYWHAFTQMAGYEPVIFERAEGCTLYDLAGRAYLDGVSSLWCNVHGHCHQRINAAIAAQLTRVAHTTSLGASSPVTIELSRRLCEVTPGDLNHVFFSSDGAAAVEVALKMAYQFWQQCDPPQRGKTKYVSLVDAYHGDTLGSVSVGGVERFHALFAPLLFDVFRIPTPDPRQLPPQTPEQDAVATFVAPLEALLRQHHGEIAAIVIEPLIQCAAGMIVHPRGFLRAVRQLATEYDVLLIADEVATGFGRTGTMFACQQEDVVPDFLCLGKGLTGGYLPMAATLATPRVWDAFLGDRSRTFCHGHTYGGNPLSAAAALACLDVFDEEHTLRLLDGKQRLLARHLHELSQHACVTHCRQQGMIAAIDLTPDAGKPAGERAARVCAEAMQRGVWLRPLRDTLVVMPPLAITEDELQRLMAVVGECIEVTSERRTTFDAPSAEAPQTIHTSVGRSPKYLLLQVRRPADAMRHQEVECFARMLSCAVHDIEVADLLSGAPRAEAVSQASALFFGGSGDYSAAGESAWLDETLRILRQLLDSKKPVFASCWGFQAIARALGGNCIHDPARAELGTIELQLTDAGKQDKVFGALPARFLAQAGHQDHVVKLPPGAILLASSDRVANQAFKLADAPVYCTQFHPELDRTALVQRLEQYPQYVANIAGMPLAQFVAESCHPTEEANQLLAHFVRDVLEA